MELVRGGSLLRPARRARAGCPRRTSRLAARPAAPGPRRRPRPRGRAPGREAGQPAARRHRFRPAAPAARRLRVATETTHRRPGPTRLPRARAGGRRTAPTRARTCTPRACSSAGCSTVPGPLSTLADSMTRADPGLRPTAAAGPGPDCARCRCRVVARGRTCPTGSGRPRCVVGWSHECRTPPHRRPRRPDRPDRRGAGPQAPLVQFFLGNPQSYKGPVLAYAGGADGLRADAEAAGVDLYVHAPYLINVATTNNRQRIPSRKLLQQHVDAAAEIGAKGLIVHGGHVTDDDDPAKGFDNWRKAVEATDLKLPLLIENTAGGTNAMTRYLDRIAGVWDAISPPRVPTGRLLPRHLPRPRRRQRAGDDRRGRPRDHRPDRPRALQRQPRRLRLRRRPARQPRRRPDRPRPAGRGGPRRRRAGGLRDAGRRRRSTSPTSPGCASGSDARPTQPVASGGLARRPPAL